MKTLFIITINIFMFCNMSYSQKIFIHTSKGVTVHNLMDIDSITFSFKSDSIPTQGLIGEWLFSGNGNDSSGYGNHGIVNGAILTNDRFGNPNSAYSFDRVNDYIAVNNVPVNTNPGEHNTISLWFSWDGYWDVMCFSSTINLWFSDGSGFGINTGNNDLLGISYDGLSGDWVHVVAVLYNGENTSSTSKIYINGQNRSIFYRRGYPHYYILSSTMYFGSSNNGNTYHFGGLIDDVRIYNRELTDMEVMQLYYECK